MSEPTRTLRAYIPPLLLLALALAVYSAPLISAMILSGLLAGSGLGWLLVLSRLQWEEEQAAAPLAQVIPLPPRAQSRPRPGRREPQLDPGLVLPLPVRTYPRLG